jgi:cation/acetate symporter
MNPLFILAASDAAPTGFLQQNGAILMFLSFVVATLGITVWSARKNTGSSAYFAAGRSIKGWQNGLAVAGDYMSAASFLGISGMIAFWGFDGFLYSVGFLVAYLTVLFVVAEPLRNAGKYTMADLLAYRLKARPVRAAAAFSTLTVSTLYMVAQMIGAGELVKKLLQNYTWISSEMAIIGVGILMIIYVVFGGMRGTTWVQIVKAILLMTATFVLSILVMKQFDYSFAKFFDAISHVHYVDPASKSEVTKNFLDPGMKFGKIPGNPWRPLDLASLGLALVLGTAGLPHVLVRFYTVPDAKTARSSVVWAMVIIGVFYILTTFLGYGAATLLTPAGISTENMAAPELSRFLGGEMFFAFISAVAFATILAVVAGLTISASTSFAHDFYSNVLHHGKPVEAAKEVRVARIASFFVGGISIFLAIKLQTVNVAFLVGLAFAVAASANLPVIILSIFWKRFTTTGAVVGLCTGLVTSIALIVVSPSVMGIDAPTVVAAKRHLIQGAAWFPLTNPGIVSIPIGFLAAILGSLFARDPEAEAKFAEFSVRAHTGLGAEKATDH